MSLRVLIVGAGLAGMNLALQLARRGLDVEMVERRSTVGGALHRVDSPFGPADNSLHLHLACFHRCLARLDELGSRKLLAQPKGGMRIRLSRMDELCLKGEWLHDAVELLRFPGLALSMAGLLQGICNQGSSAQEWMTDRRVAGFALLFWREWILSVFNAPAERVDGVLFQQSLREVALRRGGAKPLVPLAGLDQIWLDPLRQELETLGVPVHLAEGVLEIKKDNEGFDIQCHRGKYSADVLVWAADPATIPAGPFSADLKAKLPDRNRDRHIVNLLLEVSPESSRSACMRGWFGEAFQWLFRVREGQLALVGSGWKDEDLENREQHVARALELLGREGLKVNREHLLVQRRATRLQDSAFEQWRPGPVSKHPNLYYCGAWLKTGLPLSMEGALEAAVLCEEAIVKNCLIGT